MENIQIKTVTKKKLDWLRIWMKSQDGMDHDYDNTIGYLLQIHRRYRTFSL